LPSPRSSSCDTLPPAIYHGVAVPAPHAGLARSSRRGTIEREPGPDGETSTMSDKKAQDVKTFIEKVNKKDKQNGLKIRFAFTKNKRK
jgi:hypothetical protein